MPGTGDTDGGRTESERRRERLAGAGWRAPRPQHHLYRGGPAELLDDTHMLRQRGPGVRDRSGLAARRVGAPDPRAGDRLERTGAEPTGGGARERTGGD